MLLISTFVVYYNMVHPVIEFPFCLNHFACTNSKGYYNAIRVSAKVRIVESWTKKSMAILFRIICNLFFQLTRNTIPSERVVSMSVCDVRNCARLSAVSYRLHLRASDQIGLFFKVLGNKWSFISSPNILRHLWLFENYTLKVKAATATIFG